MTQAAAAHALTTAAVLYALVEADTEGNLVWGSTGAHEFADLSLPNSGYGIENPDNVYRQAMVSGAVGYELRGQMTDLRPLELHVEIRDSIPGTREMSVEAGDQVATLHIDHVAVDDDGSFTISIDASAAEGRANHMTIPADATSFVLVRDLLDDWEREMPTPLELVRTTRSKAAALGAPIELAERAAELAEAMALFWLDYFDQFNYTHEGNVVRPARVRPGGRGLSTCATFKLHDDQALVFTLDPQGGAFAGRTDQ